MITEWIKTCMAKGLNFSLCHEFSLLSTNHIVPLSLLYYVIGLVRFNMSNHTGFSSFSFTEACTSVLLLYLTQNSASFPGLRYTVIPNISLMFCQSVNKKKNKIKDIQLLIGSTVLGSWYSETLIAAMKSHKGDFSVNWMWKKMEHMRVHACKFQWGQGFIFFLAHHNL